MNSNYMNVDFDLCSNGKCPKAKDCLRQIIYNEVDLYQYGMLMYYFIEKCNNYRCFIPYKERK